MCQSSVSASAVAGVQHSSASPLLADGLGEISLVSIAAAQCNFPISLTQFKPHKLQVQD